MIFHFSCLCIHSDCDRNAEVSTTTKLSLAQHKLPKCEHWTVVLDSRYQIDEYSFRLDKCVSGNLDQERLIRGKKPAFPNRILGVRRIVSSCYEKTMAKKKDEDVLSKEEQKFRNSRHTWNDNLDKAEENSAKCSIEWQWSFHCPANSVCQGYLFLRKSNQSARWIRVVFYIKMTVIRQYRIFTTVNRVRGPWTP